MRREWRERLKATGMPNYTSQKKSDSMLATDATVREVVVVCVRVYVCMRVCVHVCMCACMHVYVRVCVIR